MGTIDKTTQEAFSWLQYVLNPDKGNIPYIQDWQAIYDFVVKQQIIGVCSPTPYSVRVDQDVLFQWIGDEQQIRNQNKNLNKRIEELSQILDEAGFRFCILKGQGNAVMYPDPELRCAGDIDVWIDANKEAVWQYVKSKFPEETESYKHIHFPIFEDAPIDMHYTPLKVYHPIHNKRLQQWLQENREEQMTHYVRLTDTIRNVATPTASFNAVYQLGHIMIHLEDEGIGLRQFVDYFYVLKNLVDCGPEQKDSIRQTWNRLGMTKLARAVMWVEKELLGLQEEYLLVIPDKKKGRLLAEEILEGGNFGHSSERQKFRNKGWLAAKISDIWHLISLSTFFPGEACFRLCAKIRTLFLKFEKKY